MKQILKYKNIAIDFDGTIATKSYPELGTIMPEASRVINKIKEHGGNIIIWTCRTGEHAEWVKKFLEEHNIPYDTFNEELPNVKEMYGGSGRKVFADVYIDDASIHCNDICWLDIERRLFKYDINVGDIVKCIKNGLQHFNVGEYYDITDEGVDYLGIYYEIDGKLNIGPEIIAEYFKEVG